jgi:hypothetical protein
MSDHEIRLYELIKSAYKLRSEIVGEGANLKKLPGSNTFFNNFYMNMSCDFILEDTQ